MASVQDITSLPLLLQQFTVRMSLAHFAITVDIIGDKCVKLTPADHTASVIYILWPMKWDGPDSVAL